MTMQTRQLEFGFNHYYCCLTLLKQFNQYSLQLFLKKTAEQIRELLRL